MPNTTPTNKLKPSETLVPTGGSVLVPLESLTPADTLAPK